MHVLKLFQAPNILLNVEVIEAKDLRPKDANGKPVLKFKVTVFINIYVEDPYQFVNIT
jgi:hypothetical protein